MAVDFSATQYYIQAYWPGRKETAYEFASRFRRYIEHLSAIDGTLRDWLVGKKHAPYTSVLLDLAAIFERDIVRSEDGEVLEKGGYALVAVSLDERQIFGMVGGVGADYVWPMWNSLDFHTTAGIEPNLAIVTYPLFKAAMLSAIASWQPAFCVTRSSKLKPDFDNEGWFAKAWMTYVPPSDAASVDLSGIPIADETPDGGLLLSATTDVFRADNPHHVEAARRISEATQHLNATLPPI